MATTNRGSFDTDTLTLTLHEAADTSTFIHESGHFFLEVMTDLASQEKPPRRVKDDVDAVMEWMGVPGGMAGWNRLSAEQRRPYHEQFAKGFEAYLMTGKAPTRETEGLFAQAKKWLVGVYRDVTSLGVNLTPEVASVFDRMVATALPDATVENGAIRDGLMGQLAALDRFPANVNQTYATLVSCFYTTQAEALGVSARELATRYPLTIRADVHGLAPEGISKHLTETPEFKAWFGDSKVVGEDGKPLVVYHGTSRDFDAFDNSKTGANDLGLWGRGHYFSAVSRNADSYALRQGDGARIIPAYVSIKNPLILTTGKDLVIRLPDGRNTRQLVGQNLDGSKIKELAMAGGHDGVIQIKPDGLIGDLVAFNANQIKSVFNRGTYEQDNPNILHQAAYHGSPHHFEQFSLDHIGKGEGAQAYGYGLYFTDSQEVAEWYRKQTTTAGVVIDGKDYFTDGGGMYRDNTGRLFKPANVGEEAAISGLLYGATRTSAPVVLAEEIESYLQTRNGVTAKTIEKAKEFILSGRLNVREDGYVYQVEIPDDGEYLLWDKPLNQQPAIIADAFYQDEIRPIYLDALLQYDPSARRLRKLAENKQVSPAIRMQAEEQLSQSITKLEQETLAGDLYHLIARNTDSQQCASALLESVGVAGIKYLDGSSRAKGEGSYNYVVFDDSRIQIREKRQQSATPVALPLPEGVAQVKDGMRVGTVKDVTPDWVIQDAGRGQLVGYPRAMFEAVPDRGACVQIACRDGKAVVVDRKTQGKGLSR